MDSRVYCGCIPVSRELGFHNPCVLRSTAESGRIRSRIHEFIKNFKFLSPTTERTFFACGGSGDGLQTAGEPRFDTLPRLKPRISARYRCNRVVQGNFVLSNGSADLPDGSPIAPRSRRGDCHSDTLLQVVGGKFVSVGVQQFEERPDLIEGRPFDHFAVFSIPLDEAVVL